MRRTPITTGESLTSLIFLLIFCPDLDVQDWQLAHLNIARFTMSPTFDSLPVEVRETILEYCLCVEADIVPCPTSYEGKRASATSDDSISPGDWKEATTKPMIGLLSVNKHIREESLRVLFGKNVWRLSYDTSDGKDREGQFWQQHIKLFPHVSTQFDMNDVAPQ